MDSVSTLVSALRQSRALDEAQLEELAATIVPRVGNDSRALASELIKRRWLTPFQINRLFNGRGQELLVGGSYVLLERLGEGGMGQVYKARNWKLGRTVALKLIRKDLVANPTVVERFRREIEVTAQLDHPNIIRAFDADETEDGLFIVMEYVEGTDLGRLVQESGPLPIGEACDSVRQVALALQHAHEKGLIHRDIKPPNLLRADQGHVIKLLDLGLARLQEQADQTLLANSRPGLTQIGIILGTVDFIAPEQARDSSSVDIRADLYSLGCTFHFLLTGKPPYPGGTPTEKLLKHTLDPLPLLKHLSPRVTAVLHKLMAKKPEDRFQTPGEAATVLEVLLSNSGKVLLARPADLVPQTVPMVSLPPVAVPVARPVQPAGIADVLPAPAVGQAACLPAVRQAGCLPHGRRRQEATAPVAPSRALPLAEPVSPPRPKRRFRLAVALGVLLASGALCAVLAFRSAAPAPTPTPDSPEVTPTRRVKVLCTLTGQPVVFNLAWSAEGSRLAFAGEKGTVHVHDVPSGKRLRQFDTNNTGVALAVACGPDESGLVAAADRDRVIHVWDISEGKEWFTLEEHTGPVAVLAFRPDGKVLASAGYDGSVRLWDLSTGKALRTLDPRTRVVSALAWHGMTLATVGLDHNVRLWDTGKDGSPDRPLHTLTGHKGPVAALAFRPDGKVLASGSADGTVVLWDVEKGKRLHELPGSKQGVGSLVFAPGGSLLAWAGWDGRVRLCDAEAGKQKGEMALGGLGLRLQLVFRGKGLTCAASNGAVYAFPSLPAFEETKADAVLRELLAEKSSGVRAAAVGAVEELGLKPFVPELTEALRDRSRPQAERVAIVRAFRKLKAMSAVSVLRSVLAEPEASGQVPLLHAEALRTLGELAPAEAEPAARALLTNKSAFLQNEAVQVLGRKPAGARQLAEEFLERKLLWNVLQRLIEVLKRHADSDAKAAELVEALERESQRGLVREFWVVGPFGRPRDLRTVFPPERKPDPEATYTIGFGESRSWKEYKTQDNGLLRLPASLPRDRGFSYALAYVQAPTAGKVTMYLGAGEPVRVWVNDRLVHEADRLRVARLDEDRVEVSLKRGWNTVLVKLGSRDRSPSELYLRFLGDALRFSLKPEEK